MNEELQAALLIAVAACSNVRFRFVSEISVTFTFERREGVELFLRGLEYYPRLTSVVINLEVAVTYLD